jgi:hypothetical protein
MPKSFPQISILPLLRLTSIARFGVLFQVVTLILILNVFAMLKLLIQHGKTAGVLLMGRINKIQDY